MCVGGDWIKEGEDINQITSMHIPRTECGEGLGRELRLGGDGQKRTVTNKE